MKQRLHPGQGSVSLRSAHREEIKSLYQRVFDEWGIAIIFPEFAEFVNDRKIIARAYTWFGDTMAFHRGFYDLADEQYQKSKDLWPSLCNPAKVRLIFGSRIYFFPKRLYYYISYRLFQSRFPTVSFR
jgi:hypothetical protein